MACTLAKFATVPIKYAPKRKFIEFAAPQWKNKLGEFSDPDVLSWINNLYQDKAFPTQKDFNKAYDAAMTAGVSWRNKTMVLTKEDVDNFEEEFKGGAFEGSQTAAQKTLTKMRAALETGEKVIFVY
jgi:CHAD domain-containing protein